jgi:hypothetical protein
MHRPKASMLIAKMHKRHIDYSGAILSSKCLFLDILNYNITILQS